MTNCSKKNDIFDKEMATDLFKGSLLIQIVWNEYMHQLEKVDL